MGMEPISVTIGLLFLAAFFGGLLGGLLGAFLTRRDTEDDRHDYVPAPVIDPLTSEQIDDAAEMWAEANDRPEAAGLVADKLRLVYTLRRRPRPFDQDTEW
jgi:hypothetical protein